MDEREAELRRERGLDGPTSASGDGTASPAGSPVDSPVDGAAHP